MMMRQPTEATADLLGRVAGEVMSQKRLPAVPHVRLEAFAEGGAAQIPAGGPGVRGWCC
jgi:hypothetical protein